MRKMAWLFVTAAALTAGPAQAQTFDPKYPVCMRRALMGGGLYVDCSYTSMAQCRGTASGLPATCLFNPYFPTVPPKPQRYRHRP